MFPSLGSLSNSKVVNCAWLDDKPLGVVKPASQARRCVVGRCNSMPATPIRRMSRRRQQDPPLRHKATRYRTFCISSVDMTNQMNGRGPMSKTESKAMAACVAFLEAFEGERTASVRRELITSSLKLAMEATGHELSGSTDAANALVARWCEESRSFPTNEDRNKARGPTRAGPRRRLNAKTMT